MFPKPFFAALPSVGKAFAAARQGGRVRHIRPKLTLEVLLSWRFEYIDTRA